MEFSYHYNNNRRVLVVIFHHNNNKCVLAVILHYWSIALLVIISFEVKSLM